MIIPITTGSGKTVSGCSIPGCDRPSRFWRVNRLTRDGVRICCVDCTDAVTASPLLFDPCGHSMACNDTLSTSWFRKWRRQQGNQGPAPTPAPSPTVPTPASARKRRRQQGKQGPAPTPAPSPTVPTPAFAPPSVPPSAPSPTPAARRPLAPALRQLIRASAPMKNGGTYDMSESERRAQGAIYRSITSPAPTSEPTPSLTVPNDAAFVRRYFPTPASARSSVPPSVPSPAPTSEPLPYYAQNCPGATLCLVSAERLAAIAALAKKGKRPRHEASKAVGSARNERAERRAERAAESSDSDSRGLW